MAVSSQYKYHPSVQQTKFTLYKVSTWSIKPINFQPSQVSGVYKLFKFIDPIKLEALMEGL